MFPCASNKKGSDISPTVCNTLVFVCWRLKNILEDLFCFCYKWLCFCLCEERELLVLVDQWQWLYAGALVSWGEKNRNFEGRGTDIYQKVREQCIQAALQQQAFMGKWLKWSNPAPANSCLHGGHCCFSSCQKLHAGGLSSELLGEQFLFMKLLGGEMFRYFGIPWKPGGVRGKAFYGRCLCRLSIWLFWRALQISCNLYYCFCSFCLFLLILALHLLKHWSTCSEQ